MNPFKELAQSIKDHKEAAVGLAQTALDCSGSVCEFRLPKPMKTVETRNNHARPA